MFGRMPWSAAWSQLLVEAATRLVLVYVMFYLDAGTPFVRVIRPEEAWLYSYPMTTSYFPGRALWVVVLLVPPFLLLVCYLYRRDWDDLRSAALAVSLGFCLNGLVTNSLKLAVGRPRPDFLERCYGTTSPSAGELLIGTCVGNAQLVLEGRKSFPSGHSSYAFSTAVFLSLYLAGKLGVFAAHGRGRSLRLLAALTPLMCAALIAASRTCDYHHHWQDVLAGSCIGLLTGWLAYRQYFPSVWDVEPQHPYSSQHSVASDSQQHLLLHRV